LSSFGVLLWINAAPITPALPVIPTDILPTDDPNSWENLLRAGFGDNSTPLPTIAIPTAAFAPPTLAINSDTGAIPLNPAALNITLTPSQFSASTPTALPATSEFVVTDQPVTAQAVTRPPSVWQPPPLIPPISRDPLGRDHYWFERPVDSNAVNYGLFYYPYGSDGPQDENPYRVHHGIDMPNPVGETVRAGGSGEVIWAGEAEVFQNSPGYGRLVIIEHDFGYQTQPLWTLYAHLSSVLVERGQYVQSGDVIGLIGQTGRVSGPHVHFEVRMSENHYRSTYNPNLWMVPYVGHGVLAGRVLDSFGNFVNDVDVTVNRYATGLVQATTTTYVFQDNDLDVNPDPNWGENFVVPDLPTGRYEVVATIDGERHSKIIDVLEGTTAFVELSPEEPATAQPVES
jgi:murein DD-endopeptidase MepM/ murein hydrolase activator NlpD